jgi:hypothetical protein
MKNLLLTFVVFNIIISNVSGQDDVTYTIPKLPTSGFSGFISSEVISYIKSEEGITSLLALKVNKEHVIESIVFRLKEVEDAEKSGQSPCVHLKIIFKDANSENKSEIWVVPSLAWKENSVWKWRSPQLAKFQFLSVNK